jgi:hypothetical protein
MAPLEPHLGLSTFSSGGCGRPPLRADLAHVAEELPIMVRAIRAHSAAETARALCTTKPIFVLTTWLPCAR